MSSNEPVDKVHLLALLRFELSFVESGGYGRSVNTPQTPTSTFKDSITCLNFKDPDTSLPCSECALTCFVPAEKLSAEDPCHHIPLNEIGDTVFSLEKGDNQAKLEKTVRQWLREKIAELEQELSDNKKSA